MSGGGANAKERQAAREAQGLTIPCPRCRAQRHAPCVNYRGGAKAMCRERWEKAAGVPKQAHFEFFPSR